MADGVWKWVQPQVVDALNNFLNLSTSSMKKGHNGEKKSKYQPIGARGTRYTLFFFYKNKVYKNGKSKNLMKN